MPPITEVGRVVVGKRIPELGQNTACFKYGRDLYQLTDYNLASIHAL